MQYKGFDNRCPICRNGNPHSVSLHRAQIKAAEAMVKKTEGQGKKVS